MNLKSITDALQMGLETAQKLAPLAASLGIPGVSPAAAIISSLSKVGANVLKRVEDGTIVATTQDKAVLAGIIKKLQAENDALAAEIEGS